MSFREPLEAAHHICAWLTVERLLIEAHIHQAVLLRCGDYRAVSYHDPLLKLAILIRTGICSQTKTLDDDELPPLLPLINQLPAHMQMQLEQAIEAERQGQATHHCAPDHTVERQLVEVERFTSAGLTAAPRPRSQSRGPDAVGPPSGPDFPQF